MGGQSESVFGKQVKVSSHHNRTTHAVWDPPEFFGFVLMDDVKVAKVRFRVLPTTAKGRQSSEIWCC